MSKAELRTVSVSSIVEMPTELGNRCLLLQKFGLNAYRNTEEELLDALTGSVRNKTCLRICLKSSRCQAFWEQFQRGITPFSEKDPIRLIECGGHYWVYEGKHRVCLAKRAGIEHIEAYVWALHENTESLLPSIGEPGTYQFKHLIKSNNKHGEVAVLWTASPNGVPPSRFSFSATPLSIRQDTGGEMVEIFPGLKYRICVEEISKKVGIFRQERFASVKSEVVIDPNHRKARIWLLSGSAEDVLSPQPPSSLKTVYRFGCWRNQHKQLLSRLSFV